MYFDRIAPSVDPRDAILDRLPSKRIITCNLLNEIYKLSKKRERFNKLYEHLDATGHPQAFTVFLDALSGNYDWIIQLIKTPPSEK